MAIDLRSFTPARVSLGRSGHSLPTAELLRFQLDHARARDAVYEALEWSGPPGPLSLEAGREARPTATLIRVHSAAPDRATFLRRPDLGRQLSVDSRPLLTHGDYDAA